MARGFKTGGRGAGVPNKRTQAKQMLAEIMREQGTEILGPVLKQLQAAPKGQKKAIEVLRDLMTLSMNCVAIHQPKAQADGTFVIESNEKLQAYLKLGIDAAGQLARFESPTFKAVALQEVPLPPAGEVPDDPAKVVGLLGKRSQQDAASAYLRLVRNDPKAA